MQSYSLLPQWMVAMFLKKLHHHQKSTYRLSRRYQISAQSDLLLLALAPPHMYDHAPTFADDLRILSCIGLLSFMQIPHKQSWVIIVRIDWHMAAILFACFLIIIWFHTLVSSWQQICEDGKILGLTHKSWFCNIMQISTKNNLSGRG